MKVLLIAYLLWLFSATLEAQHNEYWAETSSLDSLVITENNVSRSLPAENLSKTQFLFSTSPGKEVFLNPYCSSCEEQLSIKLWGKKEDAYTRWIYLDNGERISLQHAFTDYPEKSLVRRAIDNIRERFWSFWESAKTGRSARRRTPALRGGSTSGAGEPKLSFLETNNAQYLNEQDLSLHFRINADYSVKTLYIIGRQDQNLLYCAGDPGLVNQVFDLSNETIGSLETILYPIPAQAGEKAFSIDFAAMKKGFYGELHFEQWYQLGVLLENDSYNGGIYLFNFQILTPARQERLQQFLGIHD